MSDIIEKVLSGVVHYSVKVGYSVHGLLLGFY